ncbi:hypothetical protein BC829DRAFT_413396 [Chytridium lagenaria]|nr:hypothetical protein BC829DRAFT_413396 [Chytridium lagenaria]
MSQPQEHYLQSNAYCTSTSDNTLHAIGHAPPYEPHSTPTSTSGVTPKSDVMAPAPNNMQSASASAVPASAPWSNSSHHYASDKASGHRGSISYSHDSQPILYQNHHQPQHQQQPLHSPSLSPPSSVWTTNAADLHHSHPSASNRTTAPSLSSSTDSHHHQQTQSNKKLQRGRRKASIAKLSDTLFPPRRRVSSSYSLEAIPTSPSSPSSTPTTTVRDPTPKRPSRRGSLRFDNENTDPARPYPLLRVDIRRPSTSSDYTATPSTAMPAPTPSTANQPPLVHPP